MSDRPRHRDLERFLEPEHRAILRALPIGIAAALAVLTIVGMIILRPTGEQRPDLSVIGVNPDVYEAVVDEVTFGPCSGTTEADGIRFPRQPSLFQSGSPDDAS